MPGRVGWDSGSRERPARWARTRALTSSFQAAGFFERGGAATGGGDEGRLDTEALKIHPRLDAAGAAKLCERKRVSMIETNPNERRRLRRIETAWPAGKRGFRKRT
jgi:hypothetical protein